MYSNSAISAIIGARMNIETEFVGRSIRSQSGDFVSQINREGSIDMLRQSVKSESSSMSKVELSDLTLIETSRGRMRNDDLIAAMDRSVLGHKMCVDLYATRSGLMKAVYGGK